MSGYESDPDTTPIKIVPYPARRPIVDTAAVPPSNEVVPVSYDDLIHRAALDLAFRAENFLPPEQEDKNEDLPPLRWG